LFQGSIRERLALTEILLSPGGERLSPESAQICAVLITDVNSSQRKDLREFDRNSPAGIAKSVNHCIKMQGDLKLAMLILSVLHGFVMCVAAVLALLKFL
jgi:hypothetical protein